MGKIKFDIANPYDTSAHSKLGSIEHEGKVIHLTQQAYLSSTNENPRYEASAKDAEGNDYIVTWTPYENFLDFDDESDCCDWDDYTVTAL